MIKTKKTSLITFAVLVLMQLTGCAKNLQWEEEVLLNTEETITGAGQGNPLQFGAENMGSNGGRKNRHSPADWATSFATAISSPFRVLANTSQRILSVISILILGVSMSACSKTITWKEEVLLHDGTKMMVSRSQTHSGAGEIGQGQTITAISITFTPTKADRPITWELGESTIRAGQVDLDLLALDIVQGTPYIATSPVGCLVYGRLGKPNPPYLFFKYVGQQWQQISLQEFPIEIARPNLLIDIDQTHDIQVAQKSSGFVSSQMSLAMNRGLQQAEYKVIHRNPITPTVRSASLVDCPIPTGPDGLPIPTGLKSDKQ